MTDFEDIKAVDRYKYLSLASIIFGGLLLFYANYLFGQTQCSCVPVVVHPGEILPPPTYCCVNYGAIFTMGLSLLLIAIGVMVYLYYWFKGYPASET